MQRWSRSVWTEPSHVARSLSCSSETFLRTVPGDLPQVVFGPNRARSSERALSSRSGEEGAAT
jgi:hypothetical protein